MADILIIGAGNMGLAIGKGLLQDSQNNVYFKTLEGITTNTSDFVKEIADNRAFFNDYYSFFETLNNPWIILAVKPHLITPVIQEASELLKKITSKAIISVAAGIDIQTIEKAQKLADINVPIIRAMPNTPVATGNGLMGFYTHHQNLSDDFKALCHPLGLAPQLNAEQDFHIFTALAGSGPAYIFHLAEALAIGAERHGMSQKQARQVACQTLIGSATLLNQDSADNLRKKVTSPNGTTQAGLEQLMNDTLDPMTSNLTSLITKTLEAAKKRSENIA